MVENSYDFLNIGASVIAASIFTISFALYLYVKVAIAASKNKKD